MNDRNCRVLEMYGHHIEHMATSVKRVHLKLHILFTAGHTTWEICKVTKYYVLRRGRTGSVWAETCNVWYLHSSVIGFFVAKHNASCLQTCRCRSGTYNFQTHKNTASPKHYCVFNSIFTKM